MWSLSSLLNICTIIGYCFEPKAIILKKYETDLNTIIKEKTIELQFENKRSIFKQITAGLVGIHGKGIVHRDIKPSNILVSKVTGEKDIEYRAAITDFGLAAFSHEHTANGKSYLSIAGFSVRYAAPEILMKKDAPADLELEKKVDVYAFAITGYELFTGKFAWDGLQTSDIEAKVKEGLRPTFEESEIRNLFNSNNANTPAETNPEQGDDTMNQTASTNPSTANNSGALPAARTIVALIQNCWQQKPEERPTFPIIQSKIQDTLTN